MIKKLVFALALLTIMAGAAFAQVEKQVSAIRAEVAAIDKAAKGYKKKSVDVNVSTEGGAATYFSSGKSLRKISAKIYGETFRGTAELYYRAGKVIFIYWTMSKYDTQIGMDPPPKVIRVEKERYYFAGGELIRILKGKKEIKPANEEYADLKAGILELEKGLKEAY